MNWAITLKENSALQKEQAKQAAKHCRIDEVKVERPASIKMGLK
jgi:hypothetical protein